MNHEPVIALAGNPNVGKSTVFNALTGLRQHTGNWPGKTVACARGTFVREGTAYTLVDLPGTYSLTAHSAEEEIARDFICTQQPDAVIIVCDATALERNLNLALQIKSLTDRGILCVNLCDEAVRKGIYIDFTRLKELIGMPVIPCSAARMDGVDTLAAATAEICQIQGPARQPEPAFLQNEALAVSLIQQAEELAGQVVSCSQDHDQSTGQRIDRIVTGSWTGIPLMFLLLTGVFWLTITGSNYPSQLLSGLLFRFQDILLNWATTVGLPGWLRDALILGVYRVLAWVISVMLPPMAIFFPLFTFLEDLGYLPRVAFNLDHLFKKCSACGKQALCMCMVYINL